MRVNWRWANSAKNSFAVLDAACREHGFVLHPADGPHPDVTCYSLNSVSARRLRGEMAAAGCITVVGGPHASAAWRDLATIADYVVVGEGEHTLPALLSAIEKGNGEIPPGVATEKGLVPAVHSVRLDGYPPFSDYRGYIEISRGCPHACGYCQTPRIFGGCMRHRSIDAILRFAKKLPDIRFVTPNALAYGSDGISPRLEKVEELLRRIEGRCWFGTFPSEVRPEFISDEALEIVGSFCANSTIHFGAQSGSDRVLSALGRGHTVADVFDALDLIASHGFRPIVDIIIGLPFEDEQNQVETLGLVRWITGHGGMVHAHRFVPLPGTPLAGARPAPVLRETDRVLGSLALKGKVTGSWSAPEIRFF